MHWRTIIYTRLSLVAVISVATAASADTFEWATPTSGDFDDAGKWNNTTGADPAPPDVGDLALFNENSIYQVKLTGNEAVDELIVNNGDVTMISSSSTLRTLTLSTGNADANISGGFITIGSTANPVFLNLPNQATGPGVSVSVMNIGSGADGGVTVSGPNSRLDVLGNTTHNFGVSGAFGGLTLFDGATANFGTQGGTINLGVSGFATSQGDISVINGSTINTGHLNLATNTSNALGSINIIGAGSVLDQTLAGANLDVGSTSGGTGTINIQDSGVFEAGSGTTTVQSTGSILIGSGGAFNANGDIVLEGGTLSRTGGSFSLAANKRLTVQNGGSIDWSGAGPGFTLDQPGSFAEFIGTTFQATNSDNQPAIVIQGGADFSANTEATIETQGLHVDEGTMNISGTNTELIFLQNSTADILIGSGTSSNNATWTISDDALVDYTGLAPPRLLVNSSAGGTATVNVESSADLLAGDILMEGTGNDRINVISSGVISQTIGSSLTIGNTSSDDLRLDISGGGRFFSGIDGLVTVSDGGTISVIGQTTDFFARGDVLVDGGTIDVIGNFSAFTGGRFLLSSGKTMRIENDGVVDIASEYRFQDNTTHEISDDGTMIIRNLARFYDTGTVRVNGGTLRLDNRVSDDGGSITFIRGTIRATNPGTPLYLRPAGFVLDEMNLGVAQTLSGSRIISVESATTLAEPGANINVAGGLLDIRSLTMITGSSLSIDGPHFSQDGPLLMAIGSTMSFDGNDSGTSLGDPAALNGIVIAGTLITGNNIITLEDANDAVLDSSALVVMGDISAASGPAGIAAANGLTLDFGGNITGFGSVDTPDDPFKPFINNGNIDGDSPGSPIILTGYVKGVGTMNNVTITGTDAPGLSIATVSRGSVTYAGKLEIELAASGSDIINHSDTATLGGVLDLSLVGGYTPGLGDTFQFLTATSINGTFASITNANLGGGLKFDVIYGLNDVTLEVVNALVGDLDGDGFVGINDLNIILSNWNQTVPPANPLADPSGDGFVGIDDLNAVLGNWNAGTPPPPINTQANIPEPGTAAVLIGCAGLLSQSRRRN